MSADLGPALTSVFDRLRSISFCRFRTFAQYPSRVALKILCRSCSAIHWRLFCPGPSSSRRWPRCTGRHQRVQNAGALAHKSFHDGDLGPTVLV